MPAPRQKPESKVTKSPSVPRERLESPAGEVVQVIEIAPYRQAHEFNPLQIAWSIHPSRTDRRTGPVHIRPMGVDAACWEYEMLRQFREGVRL